MNERENVIIMPIKREREIEREREGMQRDKMNHETRCIPGGCFTKILSRT